MDKNVRGPAGRISHRLLEAWKPATPIIGLAAGPLAAKARAGASRDWRAIEAIVSVYALFVVSSIKRGVVDSSGGDRSELHGLETQNTRKDARNARPDRDADYQRR